MPEPVVNPITLAEKAGQISPADAQWVTQEARNRGVDPTQMDAETIKSLRPAWTTQNREQQFSRALSFQEATQLQEWLDKGQNAALVQNQLNDLIELRGNLAVLNRPDAPSLGEYTANLLKHSGLAAGQGLAAVAASPVSVVQLATDALGITDADTPTLSGKLIDMAGERASRALDEQADFAYRRTYGGGSRVTQIVGSVLGQAPEMLASGFGTTFLVRSALARASGVAVSALDTAQMTKALRITSAAQGVQEAIPAMTQRMQENATAGKDLLSAEDWAYGLSTAALIYATEVVGRFSGESRIPGKAPGGWRGAFTELGTQVGQESVQEGGQQILDDVTAGRHINWTEVGWSSFAGAIGGAMFGAPGFVAELRTASDKHVPPQVAAPVQTASDVAQLPQVHAAATNIKAASDRMAVIAAANPALSRDDRMQMASNGGVVYFSQDDFDALASSLGVSRDDAMSALSATSSAGTVEVPQPALTVALAEKDESVRALAAEKARTTADAPSLEEVIGSAKDLTKLAQTMPDAVLEDGTPDDSDQVEAAVRAEIDAATDAAGATKRTAKMSLAEARLEAARYRAAAETWNKHYAAQGVDTRVTPKQLYEQGKPTVVGDTAVAGRGEIDTRRVLAIGKNADATTVHHELMHHWLNQMLAWAQDPKAPEFYREQAAALGAWVSSHAKSVANRAAKAGITVDPEALKAAAEKLPDLNLNTAAGKAIHEAIAYTYEEYLRDGKAPAKELRKLFSEISRYFRSIYTALKNAVINDGEPLLNERIRAVFDRMLLSSDLTEMGHLSQETIEVTGMSPEMQGALHELYGEGIAASQQQAYARMVAQAKVDDEAAFESLKKQAREEMASDPTYIALTALQDQKLDGPTVQRILAGTEDASLNVAEFVQKDGKSPAEVAVLAGFQNVQTMLKALLANPDVEAYVTARATILADRLNVPSVEDRVREIAESHAGRTRLLLAELRALKSARKVAGIATKETKAAMQEKVAAAEEAGAAKAENIRQEAKLSAEAAAEKLKGIKQEMRQRVRAVADRAKLQKIGWAADGKRMQRQMREDMDAQIIAGAEYRMQTQPMSTAEIASKIDAEARALAKHAQKNDIAAALSSYMEIETLTEMQKLAAQNIRQEAKSAKVDTLEALRADSVRDAAALNQWADEQVSRLAVRDLSPRKWQQRYKAAMRRRVIAAAKQDADVIRKTTEEMAIASAMEMSVNRAALEHDAMRQAIFTKTTQAAISPLEIAGRPSILHNDGSITTYATEAERRIAWLREGTGAAETRSGDLSRPAKAIRGLFNAQTRAEAVAFLQQANDLNIYTPDMLRLVRKSYMDRTTGRVVPALMAPGEMRLDDVVTLVGQLEHLEKVAKERGDFDAMVGKLAVEGAAAIKSTGKLPPARGQSWIHNPLFGGMLNARTLLNALGTYGQRLHEDTARAETRRKDYQEQYGLAMAEADKGLQKLDKAAFKAKVVSYGVQTSREENLARLAMWGTETGRQRVMADLALRGCTDPQAFIRSMLTGVDKREAAWIQAFWNIHARIWEWDAAAAKEAGVPLPKTLPPMSYAITLSDGSTMQMTGGYAAIPYEGRAEVVDLLTDDGAGGMQVATGVFKDREEVITGKLLKLDLDSQYRSAMSHINTAAYLKQAKIMSHLLNEGGVFATKAMEVLGADWLDAMRQNVRFTLKGDRTGADGSAIARYAHRAMTFSVFAFNAKTALSQITGVSSAIGHKSVGLPALLSASGQLLMNPRQAIRAATQRSLVMRQRREGVSVDVASPEEMLSSGRKLRTWQQWGTAPMRLMQAGVDTIVWNAAYQRSMEERVGQPVEVADAESRLIADRAVTETQGSANRAEAARITQDAIGTAITFGMKWQLNAANWMIRAYQDMRGRGIGMSKRQFVYTVLSATVFSAAAFTVAGAVLQPDLSDEEERTTADYAYKIGLDVVGQTHFFAPYAVHLAEIMFTDKPFGRSDTGSIQFLGSTVGGLSQVAQQVRDERDEDDMQKIMAGLIKAGGIIPGVPSVQAQRAVKAFMDGEIPESDTLDFWTALVFGTNSTPRLREMD